MDNATLQTLLSDPEQLEKILAEASPEYQRQIEWLLKARPKQILPKEGWSTCIVRSGRGFGKLSCLSTLIPTKYGMRSLADVSVGDIVYDEKGKETTVIDTVVEYPKTAYYIHFSTGEKIHCGGEHQWTLWDHHARKQYNRKNTTQLNKPDNWATWKDDNSGRGAKTIDTDEMYLTQTFKSGLRDDREYSIFTCDPIQWEEKQLTVDPYVLGYWLGNGTRRNSQITVNYDDWEHVKNKIEQAGYYFSTINKKPQDKHMVTASIAKKGQFNNSIFSLFKGKNYIPEEYKYGSIEQRKQLLYGLMDSDGYNSGVNTVEFCSKDEHLSDLVFHLAASLGQKPVRCNGPAKLYGKDCGMRYRINFTPTIQVFSCPRKSVDRVSSGQQLRQHHRMITLVEKAPIVQMKCLSVDSPNNLYLMTESMIPTHNSYMASQWVRYKIEIEGAMSGLVIGSTTAKVNDILVEGASGILSVCPDAIYKANKAQIWWPNGAKVYLQTAEKKEGARGYSVEFVVGDEMAEWPYQKTTWQHIVAATREKGHDGKSLSQKLIVSTPKRSSYMAELEERENCIVITGSTFENRDNLTEEFLEELQDQWGNTSMYQQEVLGELLTQVEGALFQQEWIRYGDKPDVDFDKIVIAVDPAVSTGPNSDLTGIIIIGKLANEYFILEDLSGKHSPGRWAEICANKALEYGAMIVCEKNQGGQLLEKVLKDQNQYLRVKLIHAMTSKEDRIGSAAIFYEKGEVTHVGSFPELEDQMISWTVESKDSPDRLDALSHGIRFLSGKKKAAAVIIQPRLQKNRLINVRRR